MKYDLMKAPEKLHAPPGGTVEYRYMVEGCNCVFTAKGGLRQHVKRP